MYGDSQALSSDSSSTHIFPYNSTPKQGLEKNREHKFMLMESDSSTNYSQTNSGLLRFRSAPSSLLENYASGVKTERLGSRFCSDEENRMESGVHIDSSNGVCRIAAMNSQLPPQYPRQSGGQFGYLTMNSVGNMDHQEQGKTGSGLMRQNSSPAGLFSHLSSQSGYAASRGNEDISPFTNRNFASRMSHSLGMLSRINEIENENVGSSGLDEPKVGNDPGDHLFYNPEYEFGSWNDNSPNNFAEYSSVGVKRELGCEQQLYGDTQNRETRNRSHMLTHHLSLPKTSTELTNLLHRQDSVPCKIRAKRGCATHPRSIAERVRRTRISERMRKLQDLVPNMDKQTNTADMLDLAVEYIKNLEKEHKTLSEKRANCKCLASQKTVMLAHRSA